MQIFGYVVLIILFLSCSNPNKGEQSGRLQRRSTTANTDRSNNAANIDPSQSITQINTGSTTPAEMVAFAGSLKGIPYKYGSTNPDEGFDCSGFITYVFNHFKISVPRSSVDFIAVNHQIALNQAKTGDLILFTGTDSTVKVVGHMGILIAKPGQPISFMHSTSGQAYGVTETPLNAYYMGRYMKTIRVFPQNDN